MSFSLRGKKKTIMNFFNQKKGNKQIYLPTLLPLFDFSFCCYCSRISVDVFLWVFTNLRSLNLHRRYTSMITMSLKPGSESSNEDDVCLVLNEKQFYRPIQVISVSCYLLFVVLRKCRLNVRPILSLSLSHNTVCCQRQKIFSYLYY